MRKQKNKRKVSAAAALLAATLLISGCQPNQEPAAYQPPAPSASAIASATAPSPSPQPAGQPQPSYGGSLKLSMRLPLTFNPLMNEDANVAEVFKLLYEPLAFYDESLRPVPNPAVIDYVNVSADNMSAIVALKAGAVWSDGSKIEAKDLITSLNTLMASPENSFYRACAGEIAGYAIISGNSVKIDLNTPTASQLYFLMFPLIPSDFAEPKRYNTVHEDGFPKTNGIYHYKSYVPSEELRLVASDTTTRGKPYITELCFVITNNHESDILSFSHGLITTVAGDLSDWSSLVNRSAMRADAYGSRYLDYIGFNHERILTQQTDVRRAVYYSLNVGELLTIVYMGRAEAADIPLPPRSYLAANIRAEEKPASAAAYLRDNGYTDSDRDGVYEKTVSDADGFNELIRLELSILYNSENSIRERTALRLKDRLEANGFSVKLEGVPFEEFMRRLENGEFDVYIAGVRMSDYRPDLSFLFGEAETNYGRYRSEELELLLEEAAAAKNEEEQTEVYGRLANYLHSELPIISIAFRYDALFNNNDVYGCENISNAGIYYNINQWYLYK